MSLSVWALCFCGVNAAVLSVTSFLLKLLTLFWFLSHELSVELNAYRSGLPTPINSADSSSPRCPAMKMGLAENICGLHAGPVSCQALQEPGAGRWQVTSALPWAILSASLLAPFHTWTCQHFVLGRGSGEASGGWKNLAKAESNCPDCVSFGLSSWKCLLPVLEASCSPAFPPLLMGPVDSGKVYCEGWELPSLPRLPQGGSFSCCLGIHGDRTVEPEGNLELIPSFYRWWHCHLWLLPLAFHSQ